MKRIVNLFICILWVAINAVGLFSGGAFAEVITPIGAFGWPNGRTSNNPPSSAIDGNISTFTWTTEAFNTSPAHLGLDFGEAITVNPAEESCNTVYY